MYALYVTFFPQLVVDDRSALMVDLVYKDSSAYPGIALAAATVLFDFEIYCDVVGCIDCHFLGGIDLSSSDMEVTELKLGCN